MPSRRVVIRVHNGAHARPVAELARLALAHAHPVILRTAHGGAAELTSVLAVMDLGLQEGDEVVLSTDAAPEADAVLSAMASVLAPRG